MTSRSEAMRRAISTFFRKHVTEDKEAMCVLGFLLIFVIFALLWISWFVLVFLASFVAVIFSLASSILSWCWPLIIVIVLLSSPRSRNFFSSLCRRRRPRATSINREGEEPDVRTGLLSWLRSETRTWIRRDGLLCEVSGSLERVTDHLFRGRVGSECVIVLNFREVFGGVEWKSKFMRILKTELNVSISHNSTPLEFDSFEILEGSDDVKGLVRLSFTFLFAKSYRFQVSIDEVNLCSSYSEDDEREGWEICLSSILPPVSFDVLGLTDDPRRFRSRFLLEDSVVYYSITPHDCFGNRTESDLSPASFRCLFDSDNTIVVTIDDESNSEELGLSNTDNIDQVEWSLMRGETVSIWYLSLLFRSSGIFDFQFIWQNSDYNSEEEEEILISETFQILESAPYQDLIRLVSGEKLAAEITEMELLSTTEDSNSDKNVNWLRIRHRRSIGRCFFTFDLRGWLKISQKRFLGLREDVWEVKEVLSVSSSNYYPDDGGTKRMLEVIFREEEECEQQNKRQKLMIVGDDVEFLGLIVGAFAFFRDHENRLPEEGVHHLSFDDVRLHLTRRILDVAMRIRESMIMVQKVNEEEIELRNVLFETAFCLLLRNEWRSHSVIEGLIGMRTSDGNDEEMPTLSLGGIIQTESIEEEGEEGEDCMICFNPAIRMIRLSSCSSSASFCSDCWRRHIRTRVMDQAELQIACLCSRCDSCVTPSLIDSVCLEDAKSGYWRNCLRQYTEQLPTLFRCPGCSERILETFEPKVRNKSRSGMCRSCRHEFCLECGLQKHDEVACEVTGEFEEMLEQFLNSLGEDQMNVKKCPRCQTQTLKDGGCNHMTCTRCPHEYCWICLADWNTSHYTCTNQQTNWDSVTEDPSFSPFRVRYLAFQALENFAGSGLREIDDKMATYCAHTGCLDSTFLLRAYEHLLERSRDLKISVVLEYSEEKLGWFSKMGKKFTRLFSGSRKKARLERKLKALRGLLEMDYQSMDVGRIESLISV